MKWKQSRILLLFLLVWLLFNWLQAFLTELDPDEAYYWMYSKQLDWGYFDHPPMTALLIKVGYFIFQNELGVRLLFPLAQILSFICIWYLVDQPTKWKQLKLLFTLLLAMPILNIYGFVATPDGPLLLFSALFLLLYRNFIELQALEQYFASGVLHGSLIV